MGKNKEKGNFNPFSFKIVPCSICDICKKKMNIKVTSNDDLINPLTELYPWQSFRGCEWPGS